ncbi:MAG: D-2-hydroxyacid dehydrogenase [Acetobacterales bacterium]
MNASLPKDLPRDLDDLRLLLMDVEAEAFGDLIQSRFPRLSMRRIDNYADLPGALEELRPNIFLGRKITSGNQHPYPRGIILGSPDIRWIHVTSMGCDHYLPWDPEKVTLTVSKLNQDDIMSQYVLARMLYFGMGMHRMLKNQAARVWDRQPQHPLTGKTHVVVGFGVIGRAIAERSRMLGMQVFGVRASGAPDPIADKMVRTEQMLEVLGEGDYVTLILPKTPDTLGMFGREAFAAMKPGAVLINIGRGGIVDEDALVEALESGKLSGAAFDVFANEPMPEDSPLWSVENLVISPHCAALVEGWRTRGIEAFCINLERWLRGDALKDVVDPSKGY